MLKPLAVPRFLVSAALSLTAIACSMTPANPTYTAQPATEAPAQPRLKLPPKPAGLPAINNELATGVQGKLAFPTRHAYDFSVLLNYLGDAPEMTGLGFLYLPEGQYDGKIPAMIILHGSGGISEGREHEYAQLFAANGIAGFVVDYYTPRGITPDTPYAMKTMVATETDVIVDAYSALNFLARHPDIDAGRIGVIGFSYGGMATRYALDDRIAEILSPEGNRFAAHADFYGPCHQTLGHNGTTGAPYLAVFGDQDYSVDPSACLTVHGAIRDAGSDVQVEILPGAGHAWENDQPRREVAFPYIRGCTFTFDPQSGALLIDGTALADPPRDADLDERLSFRVQLASHVTSCLFTGYIMGRDETADQSAKDILLRFLKDYL